MPDNVAYWLELCDDDLKAAKAMLQSKHYLWTGFICHSVAEKALKAAITKYTNEIPPKIHDLPKLASMTDYYGSISDEHNTLLSMLNPLQIEARYPEYKAKMEALLTEGYCVALLAEVEGFLCWIKEQLEK